MRSVRIGLLVLGVASFIRLARRLRCSREADFTNCSAARKNSTPTRRRGFAPHTGSKWTTNGLLPPRRVLRTHGVGAQPRDAAARVPAHRDGQRRRPARGDGRRARLGERRRVAPTSASGRPSSSIRLGGRGRLPGPARLGQQRPDGVLLLRRRARGAPRVRHGRAARAPPPGAAAAGRRSAAWSCRSLIYLAFNAGRVVGARLGRRDVDRHRVRARDARARRAALARPAARVHAHGRRRRRRRRAARDRDRLHARRSAGALLARRGRASSWSWSASARPASDAGLVYAALGAAAWVAAAEVRHRPGRRRPRDGPAHLRLPRRARRPRARDATCSGSSASSRRPSSRASARVGLRLGDLAERAPAAALPSRGRAT